MGKMRDLASPAPADLPMRSAKLPIATWSQPLAASGTAA